MTSAGYVPIPPIFTTSAESPLSVNAPSKRSTSSVEISGRSGSDSINVIRSRGDTTNARGRSSITNETGGKTISSSRGGSDTSPASRIVFIISPRRARVARARNLLKIALDGFLLFQRLKQFGVICGPACQQPLRPARRLTESRGCLEILIDSAGVLGRGIESLDDGPRHEEVPKRQY